MTEENADKVTIPPAWAHLRFFQQYWPELKAKLESETGWLPEPSRIFAALDAVKPADTRVIILGQDPYPTPGHANGLAFSVNPEIVLPRSLRNIFKEMTADIGHCPENGDLSHWAEQGVMLLNSALTVPAGSAGGHARYGWQALPRQVVEEAQSHGPIAFILWGTPAKAALDDLVREEDFVIASVHPSPLSANRGFFGSRPFSQVNDWLEVNRPDRIIW